MTSILELVPSREAFKYAASTGGGEYAGPCPWCGGFDRFRVWPEHPSGSVGGRYYCRRCGQRGDGIQFLRETLGLGYCDACKALQVPARASRGQAARHAPTWTPKAVMPPSAVWQAKAASVVAECVANMRSSSKGMAYALGRGLTSDTVKALRLGWNRADRWERREAWGLPLEANTMNPPKKVWLPAGLVFPARRKIGFTALKIRRAAWTPEDTRPKYVTVSGSLPGLALGARANLPVAVVESEIDAMLIWQEARDLVNAVALGTAKAKPDVDMHAHLCAAPRILVALDFDETGKSASAWWMRHYPQASRWPVVAGKDVADMAMTPGLIRAWIEAAIINEKHTVRS